MSSILHLNSLLADGRCCCQHVSDAILEERGIGLGRVTKQRGGHLPQYGVWYVFFGDNNIQRLQAGYSYVK